MAEIFSKPTNEQVEKLREFLGDPLGWYLMGCAIKSIEKSDPDKFDMWENRFAEWKFLTRRMLWRFGLFQIVEHVYCLNEKNAEEYWSNFVPPTEKTEKEISIDPNAKLLKDKVRITDIAKKYGLKVHGNKAVCPFHADTNPSLTFSDSKGVFRCFGCQARGDIIKFVQMLEDVKNN